jgi:hypothetical protein
MKWGITVTRNGVKEYENSGEGHLELWKVLRDILGSIVGGYVSVEIDVYEEG